MKKLILFITLLLCLQAKASIPTLEEVRRLYVSAATEEASCNQLLDMLSGDEVQSDALMLGYKGCATMMKAKYVFNPFSKLSNFSKGKAMLEKAIAADNQNIELRYLRFTIQTNAPSFLGYHKDIENDKAFLLNVEASLSDNYLKQAIIAAIKSTG